jgi:hypothetical protein
VSPVFQDPDRPDNVFSKIPPAIFDSYWPFVRRSYKAPAPAPAVNHSLLTSKSGGSTACSSVCEAGILKGLVFRLAANHCSPRIPGLSLRLSAQAGAIIQPVRFGQIGFLLLQAYRSCLQRVTTLRFTMVVWRFQELTLNDFIASAISCH